MRDGLKWFLFITILVWMLVPQDVAGDDGRLVDYGIFAGVVDCESEGNSTARNRRSGADGSFQFLQSTWNAVADRRDRPLLVGRRPSSVSNARQLKQAVWLRNNVGASQWVCGYRFRDGTGPIWVTNEILPKYPKKCARRLHDSHGRSWRVARSVCGVGL